MAKKTFDEVLWQCWLAAHSRYCSESDRGCPSNESIENVLRVEFETWRREHAQHDKIGKDD